MSYNKQTGKEILDCDCEVFIPHSAPIISNSVHPTFEEEILAWCEYYRLKRQTASHDNVKYYNFYSNNNSVSK